MDFADVKATVANTLTVGLMAIVVIVLLKWATVKFYVPGFSEVIASV